MEPLIGVFSSSSEAEKAVRQLREHVPQDAIVCLTDPDQERISCARELGKFVGAFVGFGSGFSIGIVGCFVLAHTEIRQLLLFGFGTAIVLAAACAVLGSALCNAAVSFRTKLRAIGVKAANLDHAFIDGLLQRGNSVILVNSDSVAGAREELVISILGQCKAAEAARSAA